MEVWENPKVTRTNKCVGRNQALFELEFPEPSRAKLKRLQTKPSLGNSNFELKGKRHMPNQAENSSPQAMVALLELMFSVQLTHKTFILLYFGC